jgi:hypothetical protein
MTRTDTTNLDPRTIFLFSNLISFRLLFLFLFFWAFIHTPSGGKTPDIGSRTYAAIIRENQLRQEDQEVQFIGFLCFPTDF